MLKAKLVFRHVVLGKPRNCSEKNILTLIVIQQLPDTGKTDSENGIFCLKRTICNGRRIVCVNCQTDTDELIFVPLPKQHLSKWLGNGTENDRTWKDSF